MTKDKRIFGKDLNPFADLEDRLKDVEWELTINDGFLIISNWGWLNQDAVQETGADKSPTINIRIDYDNEIGDSSRKAGYIKEVLGDKYIFTGDGVYHSTKRVSTSEAFSILKSHYLLGKPDDIKKDPKKLKFGNRAASIEISIDSENRVSRESYFQMVFIGNRPNEDDVLFTYNSDKSELIPESARDFNLAREYRNVYATVGVSEQKRVDGRSVDTLTLSYAIPIDVLFQAIK